MRKHFKRLGKKKNHIVWICSAVVIAAFILRMPVEWKTLDDRVGSHNPTAVLCSARSSQVQDCLRDVGDLRLSQAVVSEEKTLVVSTVRRIAFRFLPVRHMAMQRLLVQRILTSKPKFLVPPARRLIVGRYIRANPIGVF